MTLPIGPCGITLRSRVHTSHPPFSLSSRSRPARHRLGAAARMHCSAPSTAIHSSSGHVATPVHGDTTWTRFRVVTSPSRGSQRSWWSKEWVKEPRAAVEIRLDHRGQQLGLTTRPYHGCVAALACHPTLSSTSSAGPNPMFYQNKSSGDHLRRCPSLDLELVEGLWKPS